MSRNTPVRIAALTPAPMMVPAVVGAASTVGAVTRPNPPVEMMSALASKARTARRDEWDVMSFWLPKQ